MTYDYVIIGAGATGLFASSELAAAGKKILVIEARERIGGRIYTITNKNFSKQVDAGAEFIHGNVPITMRLMREANLSFHEMEGEMYQIKSGVKEAHNFFDEDWELIIRRLQQLKHDIPFEQFLHQYFPTKIELHNQIKKFVEGYNAADSTKVSSFSLRDEWSQEDDPIQNRPDKGYGPLIGHLYRNAKNKGVDVRLNSPVTYIDWATTDVQVQTSSSNRYAGRKALITVPLGVLQANLIRFDPAITDYINATKEIGFGPVVKVIVEFNDRFWNDVVEKTFPSFKFIFSDQHIPTWWSQLPDKSPIITGWLAGPRLLASTSTHESVIDDMLKSLSSLLKISSSLVKDNIIETHVENWLTDPFSRGAYSYEMMNSHHAKDLLSKPIAQKLFFAGEAIYSGSHTGTVEAAFQSAHDSVKKMLSAE